MIGRYQINRRQLLRGAGVTLRYRFWTACVQYQQSNRTQNFRGGCC